MYLLGLAGIVLGGILVTDSARKIALALGMSEWLVGLTIVSIGTSLPELVTSVIAAIKKENDIAVGNVVGSNIFNIFFVLGLSSLISPISFPKDVLYDLIFLIVGSLILLAFVFFRKGKLGRIEGGLLTLMYVGYFIYIILRDFQ
ncbi:MAG: sodium:calcium antiporter [Acholeplasmatales bacterium]